jgi:hypothetical protein
VVQVGHWLNLRIFLGILVAAQSSIGIEMNKARSF